ncbi:MarR family transcriptional regulator [Psychrobium sp. MM17-31]|uniref:MarR family winged helix-turn-helix transcriptional regulator n=1 Tax=Psychrobium sp. MM17-31 TaxID=2917758 RepID=UPI001EF56163|nr:MarR family transcriptional regulator [Psychrobium sp. MM17-31]MCG7531082.1 MarR family transcriptional regulator [Psychrobium sp. MM17-31]
MKSDDPLSLDNQFCFALYASSLAMTQLYKKFLEPIGITYPQYTVLLILWEQDGVSLKAIAERLGQKSGSLTPVLKRMESEGLIKRVRGIENDRSLSVQLTEQGKALKSKASDISDCVVETSGLPLEEIKSIIDKLAHIRANILAD